MRFAVFVFLSFLGNLALAQNYTCSNSVENVKISITMTGTQTANIVVSSPFQKKMDCEVEDYTNGKDVIKGFTCAEGEGDGLPSLLILDEKIMKGTLEVVDQPSYDVDCLVAP